MIEDLRESLVSGAFLPLLGHHAPDAVLEAWLVSGTERHTGPEAIGAALSRWHPSPATLVHWDVTAYSRGYDVQYECVPADGTPPTRFWHELYTDGAQITGHALWEDRPHHFDASAPLPKATASFVSGGEQTPVYGGFSGARVQRIRMPDGSAFVLKHISPSHNWAMPLTHDAGREATLWSSGLLERVADAIESPVVHVEPDGDGWVVLMRDVSDSLIESTSALGDEDRQRILRAVRRLHEEFSGTAFEDACQLTDRLVHLAPQVAVRNPSIRDAFPRWLRTAWEAFFDVAPPAVAEAVRAVHANPAPLAAALLSKGTTLIHGDLRPPNVGLSNSRVQLLDWGLCASAPAEVDYAWWLCQASEPDVPFDRLHDDVREVAGDLIHDEIWPLALFATIATQIGSYWGWTIAHPLDDVLEQQARADMAWVVTRSRKAFDRS